MGAVSAIIASLFAASAADGSWLQATKSSDGFLFEGTAPGVRFSVDIPGATIRTANDRGRAFAAIDGVIYQFVRSEPKAPDHREALAKHRQWEVEHLRSAGASIESTVVCGNLEVPHTEWAATMANGAVSIYIVLSLQQGIVSIVVSGEADQTSVVEDKAGIVCRGVKA